MFTSSSTESHFMHACTLPLHPISGSAMDRCRGVCFERVDHEEGSVLGGSQWVRVILAHLSEYATRGQV
jgi:hypothetical protein